MVVPVYASDEIVIPPEDAVVFRGVVAARLVTPELVIVTAPVDPETPIPVPATAEVTPVLVIVKVSVALTTAVTPVPAVKVIVSPSGYSLSGRSIRNYKVTK